MTELMRHSMSEFAHLILACLQATGTRNIVQIGAEFGGMSKTLANYAARAGGTLTSIDPAAQRSFLEWAHGEPNVRHIARPSLEVLPQLDGIDAWIIDGDHNYYTVLHELKLADGLARRERKPLVAFVHDVSWPRARRDTYSAPERIPPRFRHSYRFDPGPRIDDPGSLPGFEPRSPLAVATHAGGPGNGVLTAVEDFLATARKPDRPIAWAHVPAVFGLGVMFDASEAWSPGVAEVIHPYQANPLRIAMEANQMRTYLAAREWQDGETPSAVVA